jgi:hypothetical protein
MKRILFIFCSTLMVISCNTKQTNSTETTPDFEKGKTALYVMAINPPEHDSIQVKKLDELPPVKQDEIRAVTSDQFEISLNELADGSGYLAQRHVTEPTSDQGNSRIEIICDWCGATTTFKSSEGFLNFMSACGYKLTRQTENIHGKDYVFNKI